MSQISHTLDLDGRHGFDFSGQLGISIDSGIVEAHPNPSMANLLFNIILSLEPLDDTCVLLWSLTLGSTLLATANAELNCAAQKSQLEQHLKLLRRLWTNPLPWYYSMNVKSFKVSLSPSDNLGMQGDLGQMPESTAKLKSLDQNLPGLYRLGYRALWSLAKLHSRIELPRTQQVQAQSLCVLDLYCLSLSVRPASDTPV